MEVQPNADTLPASSSRRRWFVRAGATALSLAAVWALAKPAGAIMELGRHDTMIDIPYGDGVRQKLDVYQPRRAAGAPVIVFFYGGRWQSGTKGWYRIFAATLAARGYVVVVPDYRLYPEVKFPEFIADGARALRWTHDNIARFNGDPRRVFVMGHSAGAYIAAMLALDPQWLNGAGLDAGRDIAGLIGVSGPYDFLPLRDPMLIDLFGGADRAATQPIAFAAGRRPPALLVTGAEDDIVDPGNSVRLADKLRRNGNDATEVTYPRFGHMTILAALAPVLANFFPLLSDVDGFVGRLQPVAAQSGASLRAGTTP